MKEEKKDVLFVHFAFRFIYQPRNVIHTVISNYIFLFANCCVGHTQHNYVQK